MNASSHFTHALLLSSIAYATACASADASAAGSGAQAAIIDGVADTTTTNVLATGHSVGDGELCSGVLIMPDVVLTARHCVASDRPASGACEGASAAVFHDIVPLASAWYAVDSTLSESTTYLPVDEIIELPGGDTLPNCGNDVVALRLHSPLTVAPATVNLTAEPSVGDVISIVGYGVNAPGAYDSLGVRRRREGIIVESVGQTSSGPGTSRTVEGEFVIDQGSCPGDSGGPAFDTEGKVVGLMNRGNTSACQHMIYESVFAHADWIREIALASSTRLGIELPAWASTSGTDTDAGVDAGAAGDDAGANTDAGNDGSAMAVTQNDGGGCDVARGRANAGGGLILACFALLFSLSRLWRLASRSSSRP